MSELLLHYYYDQILPQQDSWWFFINSWFFQIFKNSFRIFLKKEKEFDQSVSRLTTTWYCEFAKIEPGFQKYLHNFSCLKSKSLLLFIFCYLPQLFKFVDLHSRNLTCSQLFLFWGHFDQPWKKAPIIDQRLPLALVPVGILFVALLSTRLSKKFKKVNIINPISK